ncbi:unnamed protein product [Fraxinus pennsylvanica]|uniref:Uncharacterized protein n=1 Tax=Fraxinus pennsylvanica TaxID=56036 RepID=A0AAD1YQ93_9LAMI|nr:unnamed protein product [Fraxinus pennsylvanica]
MESLTRFLLQNHLQTLMPNLDYSHMAYQNGGGEIHEDNEQETTSHEKIALPSEKTTVEDADTSLSPPETALSSTNLVVVERERCQPLLVRAPLRRALAFEAIGKYEMAMQDMLALLNTDPNHRDALEIAGRLRMALGPQQVAQLDLYLRSLHLQRWGRLSVLIIS